MFMPSKELRSSFVPQSFSKISITAGSVRASHAMLSCGEPYAKYMLESVSQSPYRRGRVDIPSLEGDREMLSGPSTLIILIETKLKVVQPLQLFLSVVLGFLWRNDSLKHNTAILVKFVPPVSKGHSGEVNQVLRCGELG